MPEKPSPLLVQKSAPSCSGEGKGIARSESMNHTGHPEPAEKKFESDILAQEESNRNFEDAFGPSVATGMLDVQVFHMAGVNVSGAEIVAQSETPQPEETVNEDANNSICEKNEVGKEEASEMDRDGSGDAHGTIQAPYPASVPPSQFALPSTAPPPASTFPSVFVRIQPTEIAGTLHVSK